MAFDPQEFRSALRYDGARPNKFRVTMNFPEGLDLNRAGGSDSLDVNRQFTFFCKAASIPGLTVNPIPVFYHGREIKVPGDKTYPEWTVTILNDEDFKVRNAFELWMNGINTASGNLRQADFAHNSGYGRDAYVLHEGKDGSILRSYKFIGMFPTDISPIELSWDQQDVIEEYTVTFAYQWWESTIGGADGSGGEPPLFNVEIV